jgi:hypothetical protein
MEHKIERALRPRDNDDLLRITLRATRSDLLGDRLAQ